MSYIVLTGTGGYLATMRATVRKMGNSLGVILPKAVRDQMGVSAGSQIDLSVVGQVATLQPVRHPREGWAEAAALVAAAEEDPDEAAWCAFGNDGDDELTW